MLIADILAVDQVLDSEQLDFISRGRALNIWCSEELKLRVDLDLNLEAKEGLWRLSLRQIDGNIMIYSLSFAFVDDALFIGAVQGSSSKEAAALIRQATKATHGLRPPFFLIEVLRALARKWNVKRIVGVDSQFQLKANKGSSDSERVHFDYAVFWADLGGSVNFEKNWDIPLIGLRRSLDDIESKKRAMYRRRYKLLDDLETL